jgi:signal recognition particle subunit SRP72
MTAVASQALKNLFHLTLDDDEEVLNACNVNLKKNKSDVPTQHIKAVALLKLDRYDDAARFFEEAGDKLKDKARLEYAYTLYKVGRLQEAAELASQIHGQRAARHVEAQSVRTLP